MAGPLLYTLISILIASMVVAPFALVPVSRAHVQTRPPTLSHTSRTQAGGLGFVGHTQRFFGILLFAFSIAVTGVLANEVVYDKIPLKSLAPSIVVYVVFAILLILGPLVVFAGILRKTKRRGLLQYGTLATTYTGSFQKKWIAGENPDGEPLLGTGDIQSLADLGNSYSFVEHMNAFTYQSPHSHSTGPFKPSSYDASVADGYVSQRNSKIADESSYVT